MKLVTVTAALFLLVSLTGWATLTRIDRAERMYTIGTAEWTARTSHMGWPAI